MRKLSSFQLVFLFLTIGLVAGTIYFGVLYYLSYRNQGALAQEIKNVESTISSLQYIPNLSVLRAQLSALEEQLEAMPFPREVNNPEVYDYVWRAAQNAGVRLDYWNAEDEPSQAQITGGSDYEYRVHTYDVTVAGSMTQILNFLNQMEDNAPFDTVKLEDIDLEYDSVDVEWSLVFTIYVYAQPE
jgi:Tfp pilus assembly protein PilO